MAPLRGMRGAAPPCYHRRMARTPFRDSRSEAEKAFKQATTKPAELPPDKPSIPGAREQVTLRLDRDVLDFFQADGPGWQERINAALRKVAGK
jgi:uncharacterized protein (DUF4415 family)